MPREQLKTLTEQMFYILLVLRNPNFGYKIMEDVKEKTNARVNIGAGTLYALLARFEKEGYIEQVGENDRKKYYRLTPQGQNILKEEYLRLKFLVEDGKELEDYL